MRGDKIFLPPQNLGFLYAAQTLIYPFVHFAALSDSLAPIGTERGPYELLEKQHQSADDHQRRESNIWFDHQQHHEHAGKYEKLVEQQQRRNYDPVYQARYFAVDIP